LPIIGSCLPSVRDARACHAARTAVVAAPTAGPRPN
jgi:hypothetical protein